MSDAQTVLVTGGHGFIGHFVVKKLLERGHAVRCLVRETSDTRRIDGLDVTKHVGDILDPGSLTEPMQGATWAIHLAGISSYSLMQTDRCIPTVVDGTRNVLQSAKDAGVQRVAYIGSGIIYSRHEPPPEPVDEDEPFALGEDTHLNYALAKHRAEKLVDDFVNQGLDVRVPIPMETYGPNDDQFLTTGYLKEAINGWPALASHGGTMFGHVDDVAEGIMLAMERGKPGGRYILGSENATIKEIIDRTLAIAGQPNKKAIVMPTGITKAVLYALHNLGLPSPEHPAALEYGTTFAFVKNDRAKNELGWQPRTGDQVLEDTVRWLREAGHIR